MLLSACLIFSPFPFQIVYSKFTDLLPKEVLDDDDPDLQVQETDNDFYLFDTVRCSFADQEGVHFSLFTLFFLISDPKQNARSLLTPFSDPALYALEILSLGQNKLWIFV